MDDRGGVQRGKRKFVQGETIMYLMPEEQIEGEIQETVWKLQKPVSMVVLCQFPVTGVSTTAARRDSFYGCSLIVRIS